MSFAAANSRPEHIKGPQIDPERRRYKRVSLVLLGRFMRANKQEFPCQLVNISLGGAGILSEGEVDEGEDLILQFDELAAIACKVVRVFEDGFAVTFSATHRKRQRLAAQITWLINRHELAPADQRRVGHDRVAVSSRPLVVKFADGLELECNAIDVSISGASIACSARPAIGEDVIVGRLPARVVRHHDEGIGVQFTAIQNFSEIREQFG